jgi:thiol-disulfide isomerase/thioredoxin
MRIMTLRRRFLPALLLPFLLAGCIVGRTQESESGLPSTDTLIDMALRTARVDDRVVLVKFRASWCEWCARLDQALHSFELGRLIDDNYVLVDITVQESDDKLPLETPGGGAFLDSMGGEGGGIPFYVFLGRDGAKIADSNALPGGGNIGYPVSPEEIEAFDSLLEQTAPRMTAEDRLRVVEYLMAHAP